MSEKLGITQLKKDLGVICGIANVATKSLEDGKVSLGEGIAIAQKSIGLIGVIKNVSAAKAELQDLSIDEKNQLIDYFQQEFDLEDDKVETVIETVIEIALGFVKLSDAQAA